MKLKTLFWILVVLLVAVGALLLILSVSLEGQEHWLLFSAEGLVVCMAFYLLYFYRKAVKPMEGITKGIDLLREQDYSSSLRPVGQKEADRIVEVFNRMMAQMKEERVRLHEQNHLLDLLVDESPMGVIMLDFDGRVTMLNRAVLRFLNISSQSELVGRLLDEVHLPLVEEIVRIPSGASQTIRLSDAMIYRCSRLSFLDRGFAHPFILIESLTSEVVKAEKKAYEKVIRMIAHEVNNTMGGVGSAMETMQEMLGSSEEDVDLKEMMSVCIERSRSMSRFITKFADVVKIPEPKLSLVALNDVVLGCRTFMETLGQGKSIDFRFNLCPENPEVMLDSALFEQVLVNIVKNAVESFTSADPGVERVISIRTSVASRDGELHSPTLMIADNGTPISRDTETKLFTPFFSTKPQGQGIGLLLIREVLYSHGCTFSLRTDADGWTRFCISDFTFKSHASRHII